jgi:hypothetical protein
VFYNRDDEDELKGEIVPVSFVAISADCHRLPPKTTMLDAKLASSYLLPDTTYLFGNLKSFADVSMGWSPEGISVYVQVKQPFERSCYPNVKEGDCVELFFDTRDVKTSGFNTRFCHHFFFLPKPAEDHLAGEITHFRSDDAHPLCDPTELTVKASFKSGLFKGGYSMNIFIPAQCLHGYDPEQFNRIGFNYRISRGDGDWAQQFSAAQENFTIEQQPSLWSSVRLVE